MSNTLTRRQVLRSITAFAPAALATCAHAQSRADLKVGPYVRDDNLRDDNVPDDKVPDDYVPDDVSRRRPLGRPEQTAQASEPLDQGVLPRGIRSRLIDN